MMAHTKKTGRQDPPRWNWVEMREKPAFIALEDGTRLEGVKVTILWPEIELQWKLVTDTNGLYIQEYRKMLEDYRVTITPSHRDYVFSPAEYDLPRVRGDFVDLDFTATPSDPNG